MKFGQGNIFTVVCLSTGGSLYDVTSYLAAWSYAPSRGVSVPGPMFPPGGSVQMGLPTEKQAVCILLEYFLVCICPSMTSFHGGTPASSTYKPSYLHLQPLMLMLQ